MKKCLACKLEKRIDEFPWLASKQQYRPCCKACTSAREKRYQRERRARARSLGVSAGRASEPTQLRTQSPQVLAARAAALLQAGSRVPWERPLCPCCAQRAPRVASARCVAADWLSMWGHRCPHGEPCPGWGEVQTGVACCTQCAPPATVHVHIQEVIA